jgi:uncharacterized protein (TIGR02391 family)
MGPGNNKNPKPFSASELEGICKIIADTEIGLTGSEIGYILNQIKVQDINPKMTKWKRLFNALSRHQNRVQTGNAVMTFISKALSPTRFINDSDRYNQIIKSINTTLLFRGLEFREDGKFHIVKKATTLSEAERRANHLHKIIDQRNLHKDLLLFCKKELLQHNFFHAILEAVKSIAAKIRKKTGLTGDGSPLIDQAFGGNNPILKINQYSTESEISEQRGFMHLTKGLFGTFRNPTAHTPRIEWDLKEQDAIDLFTFVSYVLKRIDDCT